MHGSLKEQIGLFLQRRIPFFFSLLLVLLFCMPINSVQINYFRPAIGLISVYYWRLNRGSLFSWGSAFTIGFIIDVYSSSPWGINILLLMLINGSTGWLARYFQAASFNIRWLIFGITSLIYMLLKWAFLMFYLWRYLPFTEIIVGYFSTVMFYPLIAAINAGIAFRFLPPENIDE